MSLAWLPFEHDALERAERLTLGPVTLPVAIAEDLAIYKAVAGRPVDRGDLEQLLLRHADAIDRSRIRAVVAELAEALDEPERLQDLDALFSALDADLDRG